MTTFIARFNRRSSLVAPPSLAADRRGFTLAEVLIALTLCGIVLAISSGSLLFLSKSTAGLGNYQEMNMTSRFALEAFASDARMTVDVNFATPSSVSLDVYNSTGGEDTVVYDYDATAGTFSRTADGKTKVLLEDVERLSLTYFTLLPDVQATKPLEVKKIQLQAEMRRSALSVKNTNEIISARFMMRNRAVSNGG